MKNERMSITDFTPVKSGHFHQNKNSLMESMNSNSKIFTQSVNSKNRVKPPIYQKTQVSPILETQTDSFTREFQTTNSFKNKAQDFSDPYHKMQTSTDTSGATKSTYNTVNTQQQEESTHHHLFQRLNYMNIEDDEKQDQSLQSSINTTTMNVMFLGAEDQSLSIVDEISSVNFDDSFIDNKIKGILCEQKELKNELSKLTQIIHVGNKKKKTLKQERGKGLSPILNKQQIQMLHKISSQNIKTDSSYIIDQLIASLKIKCLEHGIELTDFDAYQNKIQQNSNQEFRLQQLIDLIFQHYDQLNQENQQKERETEKEIYLINQLDKSNKILKEGKIRNQQVVLENQYLHQRIDQLKCDYQNLQEQIEQSRLERSQFDEKYFQLQQKYNNLKSQRNSFDQGYQQNIQSNYNDRALSAYKLKASDCRKILNEVIYHLLISQVCLLVDQANDATQLPQKIQDLVLDYERLRKNVGNDQQRLNLINQVDEMDRFKRQLLLIMDLNEPKDCQNQVPLTLLLKKIRENKIVSDSLQNMTKHINLLKEHYGLARSAPDQELILKIQDQTQSNKDHTALRSLEGQKTQQTISNFKSFNTSVPSECSSNRVSLKPNYYKVQKIKREMTYNTVTQQSSRDLKLI
ncbi:UNKNOWN [Stylonychia lemnae]|uniref:Uncharacterized protein n=1 Tax=Stylonychia lemnae TaxID=5949 RepID=A0A077ZRR9_STYLE|nr:UNKNOWN [Stylonychia lemnae]|eukprot:CDW71191.1 UNKNOWN [Stylonychia lemnae]